MPKITLNLEDTILKALKLKATETNQSMSELVNDALKASLQEDLEDIKSWEERKGEDTYSYEEFLELLKKEQVI
jgi:metal-responsive CopG/Arc/MetJ family transcriptional regulator